MRTKRTREISKIAAMLLIIGLAFFTGVSFGESKNIKLADSLGVEHNPPNQADLDIFFNVWRTLDDKYPFNDAPDSRSLILGASQGLAEAYNDPYTVFFPPEDAKLFEEDIAGEFGGVGMEVGVEDNIITVIAPLKDSPAERAGIRPGDKIIQIDDIITLDLSLDKAVSHIRGERGTEVSLLIAREGAEEPLTIKVVRDIIQVPTIETELRDDDIFVISLFSFSEHSPQLFREAITEFRKIGTNKLILDLRGNPGGFLSAAIDISSWFLPRGKVIVQESSGRDAVDEVYRSIGYDAFKDNLQMVILVDGGSASASEIVAGALSEYDIATLVGSKTFGKGSVQEVVPIKGDSLLKVTISEWLTPEGVSISENGLTPDHEIEYTFDDYNEGIDPQLDFAVSLFN